MGIPVIAGVELVKRAIDAIVDGADDKRRLKEKVDGLAADGKFALLTASIDANAKVGDMALEDAKSGSLFRAGWRPYIGWASGFGITYQFCFRPFLEWAALINKWPVPPSLDAETLMAMVSLILGLGAYRTYERATGAIAKSL